MAKDSNASKTPTGRTMRAAHSVAKVDDGRFAKADELVSASFDKGTGLSITAAKALNLMIATAAGEAWKDQTHRIRRGELRAIKHLTNVEVEELLDELAAVRFKIEGVSARGRRLLRRRPLFRFIDEEADGQDDDVIEFEFDTLIRGVLERSDHYTVLYRQTMLAFDSKYALKLYEIGARQARIGQALDLSVDELRELMGVPKGTFARWPDLRRYVLDRSFIEVNQVADFMGSWKIAKQKGRIIQRVTLAFAPKDAAGVEQAYRDREAHRAVRRARRKGTEEVVQ